MLATVVYATSSIGTCFARVIVTATPGGSRPVETSTADIGSVCEHLRPEFNCTKVWPFGAQGNFRAPLAGAPATSAPRLRALETRIENFVRSTPPLARRLANTTWSANEDIPFAGKGGEERLEHVTSQSDFSDFRIERPLTVLATPEDTLIEISDTSLLKVQDNAPKHLRQLAGTQIGDPDETFRFHRFSSGVHVYVVDGILVHDHDEFRNMFSGESRVSSDNFRSASALDAYDADPVCSTAHGTHVGSLATGYGYSVGKNSTIVSVGVQPGCEESGFASDLIQGLSWALERHLDMTEPRPPAIVTMSLLLGPGGAADEVERVIEELVEAGIIVVAAAGNFAQDACDFVPARMPQVITVGALDETFLGPWEWSNDGLCVDVWAPGESVLGAGSACLKCTAVYSGTSQATPIVAGLIAHMLETNPTYDVDDVRAALQDDGEIIAGLSSGGSDVAVQFRDD